jgi:hypothetical protein
MDQFWRLLGLDDEAARLALVVVLVATVTLLLTHLAGVVRSLLCDYAKFVAFSGLTYAAYSALSTRFLLDVVWRLWSVAVAATA